MEICLKVVNTTSLFMEYNCMHTIACMIGTQFQNNQQFWSTVVLRYSTDIMKGKYTYLVVGFEKETCQHASINGAAIYYKLLTNAF